MISVSVWNWALSDFMIGCFLQYVIIAKGQRMAAERFWLLRSGKD
jgi:hypothetical protein